MKRSISVLLVYPEIPKTTYWSYHFALDFIAKKSAMPPLGLATVAACFPSHFTFRLLDMNIDPLTEEAVMGADVIFASAMIVQKNSLAQVMDLGRAYGKPVLVGGPYPTSSPRAFGENDHIVCGEIEGLVPQLVRDIEAETLKSVYKADALPELTHTHVPRFDLLDMSAYGAMAVQYSRGCPFRCEFCDIWAVYGNRPRLKTGCALIAELDALYQLGWRGAVFIVDDNFIGNKRRLKESLLPAMIHWQAAHDHPFYFFTEASINVADDDELLEALKQAGFNQLFIGIETPDKDALAETGKTQNLKADLLQSVMRIQARGIEVMAGFILGFDSDTEDIFDRQIAFIQKAAIPQAMVGLLEALPGTALYKRLADEGRILGSSDGNNTHHLTTNFKTRMDEEMLREGYRRVLAGLYGGNLVNYFKRCNTMMDRLGDTTRFQRKITFREIVMLMKSLSRQPFTAYGFSYLRFVIRNLFCHPEIFGEVIRLAIMGHHFHAITREMIKVAHVANDLEKLYADLKARITACSDAMIHRSRGSLAAFRQLVKTRGRMLKKINRKLDHIHMDFRGEITETYQRTSESINRLFQHLTEQLGYDPTEGKVPRG